MKDKEILKYNKVLEEDRRFIESFSAEMKRKKGIHPQRMQNSFQKNVCETLTDEQDKAMNSLMSGANIFLTGKAGTGKSFVIRRFIAWCKDTKKNILVCAPTGIAALNVGGATLHRTFAVPTEMLNKDDKCEKSKNLKLIDKADIILIDEISMCRIDLFQYVANTILSSQNRIGRKKQVVVVGDFFQLPPVLKNEEKRNFQKIYGRKLYAFESTLWQKMGFTIVELSEVVRQKDPAFMAALNKIRDGIPDFSLFSEYTKDDTKAITICSRNDEVSLINSQQLKRLSKKHIYEAHCWGQNDAPTVQRLELAKGARVILLSNDDQGRWANGTLAEVTALFDDSIKIKVEGGNEYKVGYYTWETKEYHLRKQHDDTYVIETDIIGSFCQIPVKLAYAITIHRSQGQTYDRVNIHPEGIFTEGQLYVALSRGRSLEGTRIVGKLTEKQLKVSNKVIDFYKNFNTFLTTTCKRGGQKQEVVNKIDNKTRGGQESVKKERMSSFSTYKGENTRNRILDLIHEDPYITSLEMVELLHINRSAIQKHLRKLTAEGWLIRSGSKKTGKWEVVDAIEIP